MEVPFVDLKAQYRDIQIDIDQAVKSVFESSQFIGGTFVQRFESTFAALAKAAHCIGVGNGTDAILVALKSLGLSLGDEVITPAFGWLSAAEMITLAGGKPVFTDVLPGTGTIDPDQVEARINSKTKGIVLIHLYGQPAHAHALKILCQKHQLFLIEDCAQAHLTEEYGVVAGNIGHTGTFSFYPTKNLGAYGDAGGIITNDPQLADRARLYANHGGLEKHLTEGINSRLDPLQAAMLIAKCAHLGRWTERRIANARRYNELLRGLSEISLPETRPNTRHTFHQYVIRTPLRDQLRKFLDGHQVQTLVHYPAALHNLPAYKYMHHVPEDFSVSNRLQREVLSLPVYPELSEEQIVFVCDKIKEFFKCNNDGNN